MVNTFVLGPNLKCLKQLDKQRLGKQRVEASQIIDILEYYDRKGKLPKKGFVNHTAVQMWMGHTNALKNYFNYVVKLWKRLGYENNYDYYDVEKCRIIQCQFDGERAIFEDEADENTFPIWFSFPPLYYSHRAALYMKDPEYYHFFRDEDTEDYIGRGYLWPGNHTDKIYRRWKMKYLEEPGTGVPSHYRLDKTIVKEWIKNKKVNPQTGRSIKKGAAIYNDYKAAAIHYGLI